MYRGISCTVIPWVLGWALTARVVQAAPEEPPRHYDLDHTRWPFLLGESVVSVGAIVVAGLVTEEPREACRWCEASDFDESIRSALHADDGHLPAAVSDALVLGAIPVGLSTLIVPAGMDGQWHRGLEDSWIIVNSFLLTNAVSKAAKRMALRERPAFHHGVEAFTVYSDSDSPEERNTSFFSGHTASAFSVASSAATLAYLRGYALAPYVAVGGGLLATAVGTLRVVGDLHWATDVIAGAAVGAGVGIAVPLLLHGRREDTHRGLTLVSVTPLSRGSGVAVAFAF